MALDFPSSPTNGQTFVSGNRTWTYNTTTSSWEASSVATSKTANYVYAAPNGSAGIPDFRALVAADIPTLNQNTTGTAATITGVYSGTITSGQVTTGLGFTPYNATNPSGYTSNLGTVTGVIGTAPIASSGGTAPTISISAATTSAAGSMSAADKTKLDGIATSANNYVLPKATASALGGVEVFDAAVQTVAANAVTSTASRTYGVQLNAADQMVVNVPWVDTTNTGTVTSVATGTGLTGGPVTSTGTISLANTTVTAGSYTNSNITVDAQGRITAASNGAGTPTFDGLTAKTGGTGTYQTSGDFRAPIFYDSNNTGYYVDPNSTSVLNSLKVTSIYNEVTSSSSLTSGTWYTIAINGGDRAHGKFTIVDRTSSYHQSVTFYASHHFGVDGSNSITVLNNSFYGGAPITHIRILDGSTYEGAALQILVGANLTSIDVYLNDDYQSGGWTLVNFVANSSNPGITNWANLAERTRSYLSENRQGLTSSYHGFGIGYDTRTLLTAADDTSLRVTTVYGYADIGPKNSNYNHIYTNISGGHYFDKLAINAASFRAPIFYDSDDTNRYVDPNSTSQIGSTYVNGYFQVQYNSGNQFAGMGIRNNYGSASAQSTGFIDFTNENGIQKASVFGRMATDGAGYLEFLSTAAGVSRSTDTRTTTAYAYSNQWSFQTSAGISTNIIYDRDDTSRYLDINGANVSNVNTIISGIAYFRSNPGSGVYSGAVSNPPLQVYSTDGGSAFMSFHRSGAYAVNMGLDPDNLLRIGGWSAAANRWVLDGSGNNWVAGSFRAPIFYDSDNTAYYGDFASTSILRGLTLSDGSASMTFSSSTSGRTAAFGMTDAYNMYLNAPTNGILFLSNFQAPIMYDRDNSGYYVDPATTTRINNLNILGDNPVYPAQWTTRYQSGSDFVNGTLVTTDIPATATNGDSFVIEITGKSYDGSNPPFKVVAQGYLYNDTIMNYSGVSYGGNFSSYIKVFQDGGVLKFWWPRISYWNSFNVNVMAMDGPTNNTITRNRVTTIGNATEPTGTKKQQINLSGFMRSDVAANNSDGRIYLNNSGNNFIIAQGGVSSALYMEARGGGFNVRDAGSGSSWFTALNGICTATASSRAPIFYDTDNTGYYVDPNSTSRTGMINADNLRTQNNVYIDQQYGSSLIGAYSSTRYQGVYAMGDAYKLAIDGTTAGNLYGIAWAHPNAGGVAGNLNTHGALFLENGGFLAAVSGSIRSRDDMRTPIYYDSNNTAYYINGDSTSAVKGAILIGPNVSGRYTRIGGDGGATDECTLSASNGNLHIDAKSGSNLYLSWYNTATTQVGGGIASTIYYDRDNTSYYVDPTSTTALRTVGSWRADSSAWDGEFNGKIQYHSNNWYFQAAGEWIFRKSDTNSAFWVTQAGIVQCVGDMRAPTFYDYNNTGYYINPEATSNIDSIYINGGVGGIANDAAYAYAAIELRERSFGGAQDDTWATAPRIGFHWGGRVASQIVMSSNGRINVRNNPGTDYEAFQCGTFYAPIRYDSDNTVYYTNPAGTSVLSSIALGGATSVPQGALWMSGEIWISGNGNRVAFTTDTSTDGTPNTSVRGSSNDLIVQNWSGSATNDNFWVFGASRDAACAGNITAYYSDERLKTKTGNLDNALEKVMSLEGFTYIENEVARSVGYNNSKQQVGLSAQKVKAVLPEAVALAPFDYDPQEDGTISSKSGEEYLTVDYSRLVPLLIEAIKEQQSHITKLEEKLNKLLGE